SSDAEGEGHTEDDAKSDNEEDNKNDKSNEGSIVTKTSKWVNQFSIPAFLQEVSQDIINQCVILASITQDTKFDKIEINPTKKIATLKNN
ncbi:22402_t:CDS:2, partial [Cetraspora pellucida]